MKITKEPTRNTQQTRQTMYNVPAGAGAEEEEEVGDSTNTVLPSARHHAQPHGRMHGDERGRRAQRNGVGGELRFRETLAAARVAAATARVAHPPHSRCMAVGTAGRHARRHAPQAQQKHRTNRIKSLSDRGFVVVRSLRY